MAETKYGKLIITDSPEAPLFALRANLKDPKTGGTNVVWINNELNGALKDAFYLNVGLVWKKWEKLPPFQQHTHPCPEYIGFQGSDPQDPFDLHGVVELWLGEEKHIITKSCAVYVPKGLYHAPVVFHRVDRPILYFSTAPVTHYAYPALPQNPPPAEYGKP